MIKFLPSLLCCALGLVSTASADKADWLREARFGMFIHWGVYAVPAGEWQGKRVTGGPGEWIMKCGSIPIADYKKFANDFTASKYDPEAWVRLAKKAGMKYIVITSKHHDGFALYDSKVTDWDVMSSAANRDLLMPLAKAARAEGLKFGLYYSHSQDWCHPGGGVLQGGRNWGKRWDPAQEADYDEYLRTIALRQAEEIIQTYQPSILWWDTPVQMTPDRVKPFADLMARHPEILNNDRMGQGFKGDTITPEQHIPARGYPGKLFEVCMTMNNTWGYQKHDNNWKSADQFIRNLSDISSKGGNYLLNVGPTAEGVIPAASIERLEAVGRWMDINGEAIHGTQINPFPHELYWGRATLKIAENGAHSLYLHVWDWPSDGKLLLPTLQDLPVSAKLLQGGATVTAERSADGVIVQLPGKATDPVVSMVQLDFKGPLTITQPLYVPPSADGVITLTANDADRSGTHARNIRVEGPWSDNCLADWNVPDLRVKYHVRTPSAGKWKVSADVASQKSVTLGIRVGKDKDSTPAKISATSKEPAWHSVDLGTIDLPEGESTIELVPDKTAWGKFRLRTVHLLPVKQ